MRSIIKFILCSLLCGSSIAVADDDRSFKVTVQGRERIISTRDTITLGDIAEIRSSRVSDDEAVIALAAIEVAQAPAPKREITLSAHQILETLRAAGVALKDIGYSFPRIVTIEQAAREVTEDEIRGKLESFIAGSDPQATVRGVKFKRPLFVAPEAEIESIRAISGDSLQNPTFQIAFAAPRQVARSIMVTGIIDRWVEVAVSRRPIERGEVISHGDMQMARLNVQTIPADALNEAQDVVGLESKRRIAAGEVIQKGQFVVPTIIKSGERVTIRYASKLIEATATGAALEPGGLDQPIRVRNDSSSKVLTARVKGPGLVEIQQ
jgi:flagella basal body P-ring formation protein FlgA